MRYTVIPVLVFAVLLADATGQRGRRRDRRSTAELTQFTYQVESFDPPSMRDKAQYGVYLPKGYEDKKNAKRVYPWAIWLHGMRGSHRRFRSRGAGVLDELRKGGKIPEMILVTPNAGSRPLYMNAGRGYQEEDYILKDLRGDVEKKFRVSKSRNGRAILGVSMGAFGAMKMALRHPTMFGSVAVHSSPILPADPAEMTGRFRRTGRSLGISDVFGDPIDKKKWAKEIPAALIETTPVKDLKGLRIYFDAGSRDRYGFGPPNVEFSKLLKKRKVPHTFRYIQGGGHSWGTGSIQKAMRTSLVFVAKGFRAGSDKELSQDGANEKDKKKDKGQLDEASARDKGKGEAKGKNAGRSKAKTEDKGKAKTEDKGKAKIRDESDSQG